MKIKVSSNLKGKFTFSSVYGTYSAGEEITLTKEQMESPEIQSAIKSGFLEGENSEVKNNLEEYKNLTSNKISFSWGLIVSPNQVFLIDKNHINTQEFAEAVKNGLVSNNIKIKNNKNNVIKSKDKDKDKETTNKEIKQIEEQSNSEEIEFVDIKQTKERLSKMRKND